MSTDDAALSQPIGDGGAGSSPSSAKQSSLLGKLFAPHKEGKPVTAEIATVSVKQPAASVDKTAISSKSSSVISVPSKSFFGRLWKRDKKDVNLGKVDPLSIPITPATAADALSEAIISPSDKGSGKRTAPKLERQVESHIEQVVIPKKQSRGSFDEFLGFLRYFGLGKHRILIVQNLGTMLNAGLPLIDSLKTLYVETKAKPVRKLLQRIMTSVENGSPLWRAMEEEHFFSPHALALIQIGEEAGNLAKNMEYLAVQQEKDQNLRQKVKMAMIYPVIVLILMFVIVMGLGLFVLPNLIQVLLSLNAELPLITRMLIRSTEFMNENGIVFGIACILGFFTLFLLGKFTEFRIVIQFVLFLIPGVGRLIWEATIARFGVILGGLLQAGVPLIDAIHSLIDVTTIASYKRFYTKLLEHISVGDSFSKSFMTIKGSEQYLPISVQQLVMTGERTGSLAKIMLKVSEIYEKKANETAQKLPIILEPLLLLIMGGLVATIALAIIVPIYSIVGNLNT